MRSPEHVSGRTCMVRLVDRRTGAPLRVDGAVVTLMTRNPEEAVRDLMAGRNPSRWDARVDPIDSAAR